SEGVDLLVRFESSDRLHIDGFNEHLDLVPQHENSSGWSGIGASGIGGAWVEDTERPSVAAVIEDLGTRAYCALLLPGMWCVTVATRRRADSFAGHWLRFEGGQALGAPYRAPGAPTPLGDARLMRVES